MARRTVADHSPDAMVRSWDPVRDDDDEDGQLYWADVWRFAGEYRRVVDAHLATPSPVEHAKNSMRVPWLDIPLRKPWLPGQTGFAVEAVPETISASAEPFLARGTRLTLIEFTNGYNEGIEESVWRTEEGPHAGTQLLVPLGGRYGVSSVLCPLLLCALEEQLARDPDLAARVLEGLWRKRAELHRIPRPTLPAGAQTVIDSFSQFDREQAATLNQWLPDDWHHELWIHSRAAMDPGIDRMLHVACGRAIARQIGDGWVATNRLAYRALWEAAAAEAVKDRLPDADIAELRRAWDAVQRGEVIGMPGGEAQTSPSRRWQTEVVTLDG